MWIISDFLWLYVVGLNKDYPQIVMWIVFIFFNLYGWHHWYKEQNEGISERDKNGNPYEERIGMPQM